MEMLEKVRYADYLKKVEVEAYTDGYSYDRYSHLYLISIAGYEARVKAITSALVTGRDIEIVGKKSTTVDHDFSQKYRILGTRLGSGLLHQVVLAEGFFKSPNNGDRLLYIDEEINAAELVYHTVKKDYPVPLIPEWSEWFYRKIKQENCLEELSGTKKVLRLSLSPKSSWILSSQRG